MAAKRLLETTHSLLSNDIVDTGVACIELDGEKVVISEGPCGRLGTPRLQNTVIMPGLCNMHAHILDAFMPERHEDMGLHELVSHPNGAKFRELERVGVERLLLSVEEYLAHSLNRGVVGIVSYIEITANGWSSVMKMIGDDSRKPGRLPIVYPRVQPREKRLIEYKRLALMGLGLGLDTPLDFPREELRGLVQEALSSGVGVQVHVSEDLHMHDSRDYEVVMGLRGLEAVHLTHADREQILELARSGVRPVFCPRSNATLVGKLPPLEVVEELFDQGLSYGWGTDNAAWVPPDVAGEALISYLMGKSRARSPSRFARAIIWGMVAPCREIAQGAWIVAHVPLLDNSGDVPRSLVKRLASSTIMAVLHKSFKPVVYPGFLNVQDNKLLNQGALT